MIAIHPWVKTRRQSLQRGEPPFGFTSRLRRETRLQRWIHRNALAHESRLYKWSICRILFSNWYYLLWGGQDSISVNLSRKLYQTGVLPSSPNPFSQGRRGIECLAPLSPRATVYTQVLVQCIYPASE
ncbi:hypothetical protein [Nostoc sp.]|uniref:hypothetical protein n=1 Tax=Nostoc sp. TaxID=1180 RepID=UPI002FFA43B5